MEEFRFHLTLSGRLAPDEVPVAREALDGLVAPVLPRPFVINAISLFGADRDGFFHLIARSPLAG